MMFRRLAICILIAAPLPSFAASKEIQELQRDIATLQELIKSLQRSQDQILQSQNEKFAALQVLVQQSFSAANSADKAMAVIQSNLQQSAKDQEARLLPPVAQLSTRMTSVSDDLRTVQQAVGDLTASIVKIQTQLADISSTLKVLQAPPAAPPPVAGAPLAGGPAGALDAPPLSAREMLANADSDRLANHLDLALAGYSNFLKYYSDSPSAPDAMFYIGYIHTSQKDYDSSVRDFDALVERFPSDNKRAPQALYQMGLALLKLGRKSEAAQAFRDAYSGYPASSSAKPACEQLQLLSFRCDTPKAPAKNTKSTTKKK